MGLHYKFTNADGKELIFNIPIITDEVATSPPIISTEDFYRYFDEPFVDVYIRPEILGTQPPLEEWADFLITTLNSHIKANLKAPASEPFVKEIYTQTLFDGVDIVRNSPWTNGDITLTFYHGDTIYTSEYTYYKITRNGEIISDRKLSLDNIYSERIFAIKSEQDLKENKNFWTMAVAPIKMPPVDEYVALQFVQCGNHPIDDRPSPYYGDTVAFMLYDISNYAEQFDPSNPYEEPEGETGGHPTPPVTGGITDLPLPTLSLSGYGYNLYQLTPSQLYGVMLDLWNETWLEDLFDTNEYKLSNIVSVHMLPFTHTSSVSTPIKVGNKTTSTGQLTSEYAQINCGSVTLSKLTDNYLSHEPYCNIQMYLPYVGLVDLTPSKVNGKTVKVMYNVHVPTGYGIASIWVNNLLYSTYTCNMYTQCPISANSNSTFMSAVGSLMNLASNPTPTGVIDAVGNVGKSAQGNTTTKGTYGSVAGFMNLQKPYLIRSYPNAVVPRNSGRLMGKPTYQYTKIKNAGSGFVRVDKVKLDGVTCSDTVKAQIESALNRGVYW